MTSEIARIESMIQSTEAFGSALYQADECAESITRVKTELIERNDSLRESLMRIEAETTPRVLEMARRVFSGYENDAFRLNINMFNEAKAGIPELIPYAHVNAFGNERLITIEAIVCGPNSHMTAIISPNTTNVRRKLAGIIPLKDRVIYPSIKLNYSQGTDYDFLRKCGLPLSKCGLPPTEIFKLIADKYAIEDEKRYLDTYVEMYARLPQLITRIGEGLKRKEEARMSKIEESMQKTEKLMGEQ